MSTNTTTAPKSAVTTEAEIEDRTRRALTEYMTVLSEGGDIYTVVGQNAGGEYRVDAREGRCTCPDAEYRLDADEACKHERRVAFATGEVPIPAGVAPEDVDDHLGEHVDGEVRHVATDGGSEIVVAGDDAEILDEDGEDDRPADCQCWDADLTLPCFPCYREGFEEPNPETPAADEDDE